MSGHVTITTGVPTHKRMVEHLDTGTPLPVDLRDGAVVHLSCFNRELPDGTQEALYLNPTTSTR